MINIGLAGPSRMSSFSDNAIYLNNGTGSGQYELIYHEVENDQVIRDVIKALYEIAKNKKTVIAQNRFYIEINTDTDAEFVHLKKCYKEILTYIFAKISDSPITISKNAKKICINLPNICVSRELFIAGVTLIYGLKKAYVDHPSKFQSIVRRTNRRRKKTKFNIWIGTLRSVYPHIWRECKVSPFFRLMKEGKKIRTAAIIWDTWKFADNIPQEPVVIEPPIVLADEASYDFSQAIDTVGL